MRDIVVLLILNSTWLNYWPDYVSAIATAGPYDVKIESVGRCASKAMNGRNTLAFASKMQRVSRKKLLVHVNATFSTSLSDEQKRRGFIGKNHYLNDNDYDEQRAYNVKACGHERIILLNLAKKTSQGWKDNYFIAELPKACSFLLSTLPDFKKLLVRTYNVAQCPIPAGNYYAPLDLNLDTFTKILPAMEYGKNRARVFIRQGSDTLACIEAFVEYVPKKSG